MRYTAETLLDLLPAVHRLRDAAGDGVLRELLDLIAGEIGVIEENLDQLYDDQFIETCAEWVIPYIGGLIGYTGLHGDIPRISSPRAEVANTISYRRRKGTPLALEQVTHDVTGCSTHVVEYFQRLGATQYMNHLRPEASYAPDLRRWEPLERIDTAFDAVQHTIDVRSIENGAGRYNIPNIGVWLWRLQSFPLTTVPAFQHTPRQYLFDPLGRNTQLFNRPPDTKHSTQLVGPLDVPEPISRRRLDTWFADYYGPGRSILLIVDDQAVDPTTIVAADLSNDAAGNWAHKPKDQIAIDPVLGRIAFAENAPPPGKVFATWNYGFSSELGGGEYERAATFTVTDGGTTLVQQQSDLQDALTNIHTSGAIEIQNNLTYDVAQPIALDPNTKLELRAKNAFRPVLRLMGDLEISGGDKSEVTLNGLIISGGAIRVPDDHNNLRVLRLRHCTIVPGQILELDGAPRNAASPGLIVEIGGASVEIDHCIIGGMRIDEGSTVAISNSIIDATSAEQVAFSGIDGNAAGGPLQIVDATIIGKVWTVLTDYVSNTIFISRRAAADTWQQAVRSERSQSGCVRFSWFPPDSFLPRQYHCQPELEIQRRIEAETQRIGKPLGAAAQQVIAADVHSWLEPRLTSARYGDPGYAQLHLNCPAQIITGADDESEMGAFHELQQPHRDTNLRRRIDEYLRFGLQAGVCYAT